MLIEKLELENFRSHKDTKIDLNQGITLILGENGAGKSSILEAINFALFGKLSTNLDESIRRPTNEEDEVKQMQVRILFKQDGKTYEIKRGRKKNTTAELSELRDGKKIILAKAISDVNSEIESLLNIDNDSFQNAVYIKQGEITKLTESKPAEKKKLIAKLLNIDSVEKAYNHMNDLINIYKSRADKNSGRLMNLEEIKENKKLTFDEIKQLQAQLNKQNKEVLKLKEKLDEKQKQEQKQKESKNQYEKLEIQIKNEEKNLSEINERLMEVESDLNKIQENELEIQKIKKELKILPYAKKLSKLKEEYDLNIKLKNGKQKQINDIEEKKTSLKELQKVYDEYLLAKDEKEKVDQQYELLNKKVMSDREVESQINSLKKQRDDFQANVSNAMSTYSMKYKLKPTMHPMTQLRDYIVEQIELLNNDIKNLDLQFHENDKKISSNNSLIRTTRKSLSDLQNTADKCPICQSEITHEKHVQLEDDYQSQIIKAEEENQQIKIESDKLNEKINTKQAIVDELNLIKIDELVTYETEYFKAAEAYDEKSELLDEINKNKKEYQNILDKQSEINAKVKKLQSGYDSYHGIVEALKNQNVDILLKEYENLEDEISYIKAQMKQLTQIVRIDEVDKKVEYLENKQSYCSMLEGTIKDKSDKLILRQDLSNKKITLTNNLANYHVELKNLDYDHEIYLKLSDECRYFDEKIKEFDKNISANESRLNVKNEELKKIEENLTKIKKIEKDQTNIKDYIKVLNKIREVYSKDGIQSDLRCAVKPQIEHNTMQIFNEFGFDYSSISLDDDYNITVTTHSKELSIDQLSGGEKIVIALALRLGIAKTLAHSNTELLILDEPTIHLDSERRNSLLDIISKINLVPQMLVVTHDEDMESLSNSIIKVKKDDAISYVEN